MLFGFDQTGSNKLFEAPNLALIFLARVDLALLLRCRDRKDKQGRGRESSSVDL